MIIARPIGVCSPLPIVKDPNGPGIDASSITSGTIDAARLPVGAISAVTYGAYGPTAMTVDGYAYTLTYENGKVKTVTGAGKTKTFTWSGDELVSVVVI